tara:strand:- start:106 stop:714 length:609 start_codon:yes stop_codon:yes gene_type:complete
MDITPDDYPEDSVFGKYHKFYDPSYTPHMKAWELKERFEREGHNWEEYFVFGFARNPWDREVSNYEYKKRCIQKWTFERWGSKDWAEHCIQELNECKNFINYIKKGYLLDPSMDWFLDKDGTNLASKIYQFEDLEDSFEDACECIGIPHIPLGHVGFSGRQSTREDKSPKFYFTYHEYFDEETAQIVANHYKADIDYFGYEY